MMNNNDKTNLALVDIGPTNFLARVVYIDRFYNHPNPECTNKKIAKVLGYQVVVDKSYKKGMYVYFPVGCRIAYDILRYCNLFKNPAKNADGETEGIFYDNCKVMTLMIKGAVSMGFLLLYEKLEEAINCTVLKGTDTKIIEPVEGECFDAITIGHGFFNICSRYSRKRHYGYALSQYDSHSFNRVITELPRLPEFIDLRSLDFNLQADTNVCITEKITGLTGFSTRVPGARKLGLLKRFGAMLGIVRKTELCDFYGMASSDCSYILNPYNDDRPHDIYYYADKVVREHKVDTFYPTAWFYEIVGFHPNGNPIREGYTYGCVAPEDGEEFTYNKHFKIFVVEIASLIGGEWHFEIPGVMRAISERASLPTAPELFSGTLRNLFPKMRATENYDEKLVEWMSKDTDTLHMEQSLPDNPLQPPYEGIIISHKFKSSNVYKLDSFRYLRKVQRIESKELYEID